MGRYGGVTSMAASLCDHAAGTRDRGPAAQRAGEDRAFV